jgi:hypothetical protein
VIESEVIGSHAASHRFFFLLLLLLEETSEVNTGGGKRRKEGRGERSMGRRSSEGEWICSKQARPNRCQMTITFKMCQHIMANVVFAIFPSYAPRLSFFLTTMSLSGHDMTLYVQRSRCDILHYATLS